MMELLVECVKLFYQFVNLFRGELKLSNHIRVLVIMG
jgi:hypothetical protein